jgi:hypothetical protein
VLAVLIIIAVFGVGLPVGLWLASRRRMSRPFASPRPDPVDQWLHSEFGLSRGDRTRVRLAVIGPRVLPLDDGAAVGKAARDPAQLPEHLLPAARGLAERVLADQVPGLPSARSSRWLAVALAFVPVVVGVGLIVTGHGDWLVGIVGCAPGWLSSWHSSVYVPRRARRNAQWLLRADGADPPARLIFSGPGRLFPR